MNSTESSEWIRMSSLTRSDKLIVAIVLVTVCVCSLPIGGGVMLASIKILASEGVNFHTVLLIMLSAAFSVPFIIPPLGGWLTLCFPDAIQVNRFNQKLLVKRLGFIAERYDLNRVESVTIEEKYDSMNGFNWYLFVHSGGRRKLVYSSGARGARDAMHLVANRIL